MPFSKLSLPLQQALAEARFSTATPIQEKVIPLVLERKDIMARAQKGRGKSASVVLPLFVVWGGRKEEGKEEGRKVFALKLLAHNFSLVETANPTDLSIIEIKKFHF